MALVGTNVSIEEKGGKLIIEIDINKEFGLSKSGKTKIIGSTGGNAIVAKTSKGEAVTLGLNCYKK